MVGTVLLIATLIIGAQVVGGEYKDTFEIPGTESQAAFDLLSERFQGLGGGDAATIVLKAEAGFDAPETKILVADIVAKFAALPGVAEGGVVSPYDAPGSISQDGTIARFDANYTVPAFSVLTEDLDALFALRDEVSDGPIRVELAGAVATAVQEEPGNSELVGMLAAIIILLIAFGSVVAMGLPILTALLGILPGLMLVKLLAAFVDLASFTEQFALMIAMGVGIDYALLLVTRFREGVTSGLSVDDAIARAMTTAGRAVLFAGTIVIVSLFGLWASGLPFIGWVATATAFVVSTLVIVALFVLPAVLHVIGPHIDKLTIPFIAKKHTAGDQGAGTKWARIIARYPVLWVIV
jgi:RND superfamily putative drug exporter